MRLLLSSTVICVVALIILMPFVEWKAVPDQPETSDPFGRNDESTPMSFILPATPAVAVEQEKRLRLRQERASQSQCLKQLRVAGYDADEMLPTFTARNMAAIFKFQKNHDIAATAKFDSKTRALLGCP
jgi:hypothetical protein